MSRSFTDMRIVLPISMTVRHMILGVAVVIASVLLLVPAVVASRQRSSPPVSEESAIRALLSHWIDAYQHLDAKKLAGLETPDVEVVDRFGEVHLPSGHDQNEKLWSAAFEMVSKNTPPAKVSIERVQFLRPDVAVVQVSWQFTDGILLVDGERIPPFSQLDTFVVTKSKSVWLVAAHNMHEKKP